MNNRLHTTFVALAVLGAASAAVAQTGALIGERYAALDLAYVDYSGGGHLTAGTVTFNVPSTIKSLDLAFDATVGDGGYSSLDTDVIALGATAIGYTTVDYGIKPFISGRLGWERDEYSLAGYSDHDASFMFALGAGVEVPCTDRISATVGFGYYDYTSYDDGDGWNGSIGGNYAINDRLGVRASYTRDFETDSNTFSIGVYLHY